METKNIYSRKQNRQLQKEFDGGSEFGYGTGSMKNVVTKTGSNGGGCCCCCCCCCGGSSDLKNK